MILLSLWTFYPIFCLYVLQISCFHLISTQNNTLDFVITKDCAVSKISLTVSSCSFRSLLHHDTPTQVSPVQGAQRPPLSTLPPDLIPLLLGFCFHSPLSQFCSGIVSLNSLALSNSIVISVSSWLSQTFYLLFVYDLAAHYGWGKALGHPDSYYFNDHWPQVELQVLWWYISLLIFSNFLCPLVSQKTQVKL